MKIVNGINSLTIFAKTSSLMFAGVLNTLQLFQFLDVCFVSLHAVFVMCFIDYFYTVNF